MGIRRRPLWGQVQHIFCAGAKGVFEPGPTPNASVPSAPHGARHDGGDTNSPEFGGGAGKEDMTRPASPSDGPSITRAGASPSQLGCSGWRGLTVGDREFARTLRRRKANSNSWSRFEKTPPRRARVPCCSTGESGTARGTKVQIRFLQRRGIFMFGVRVRSPIRGRRRVHQPRNRGPVRMARNRSEQADAARAIPMHRGSRCGGRTRAAGRADRRRRAENAVGMVGVRFALEPPRHASPISERTIQLPTIRR